MTRRSVSALMAVEVPEGQHGPCRIERFTVGSVRDDLKNFQLALDGRSCLPGTYTGLMRGNTLWMSDTTAERSDHLEPALHIQGWGGPPATRVLLGGLGLGMILRVALLTPEVEHVDVVEIDPDVIALVEPHYAKVAADQGKTLTVHEADVFGIKWPTGTRWDVAWFDVWPTLCEDDLEEHARLNRSYGRRTGWCGCWGHEFLLRERRRNRDAWWNR